MKALLYFAAFIILLFLAYPYISAMNGGAGITADSSLYKFDLAAEKITGLFIFGTEDKAENRLELAKERLLEIKDAAKEKKESALEKAYDQYVQLNLKSQLLLEELKLEELEDDGNESVQNIEKNVYSQKKIISEINEDDDKITTLLLDYNDQLERKVDQLKDRFGVSSVLSESDKEELDELLDQQKPSGGGVVGLVVLDPNEK